MKTLVTGGVRSGKSAAAEAAVSTASAASADNAVVYVATGPTTDDPDWADRIAAHRERRPASWTVLETTDLAAALSDRTEALLVDCLGTWLTARLDALAVWDAPGAEWAGALDAEFDAVVDALAARREPAVLVSNEVGLGLVAPHRSGRIFADSLGRLNQRVAAVCDRVVLVVAGQSLAIK